MNWILWSDVTSTAIIIIPEEAECLIPIIRDEEPRKTYLMTYAAPVTRRMLHFQNLDYYTIPALPAGWQAPQWLKAELGLFAGRLYFEWEEYSYLADLYGISEDRCAVEDGEEKEVLETNGQAEMDGIAEADGADESDEHALETARIAPRKLFVSRPLNFMQEWLAVRRRGQDFSHTPLGFIASGKPLFADHPFFRQDESGERGGAAATAAATLRAATGRIVAEHRKDQVDEDVVYEGGIDVPVSDSDSSSDEESVEYHDDELYSADDDEQEDGCGSPELPSSGDDGRRGRGRGNRGGKGRRGR